MPKLPEKIPDDSWSLLSLAAYAVAEIEEMHVLGRRTSAQIYRIGRALHFAWRKAFAEAKWKAWLAENNIPERTAWEAIKLYEAVKDESDLEGLSPTEAKVKFGVYPELALTPEHSQSDPPQSSSQNGRAGSGLQEGDSSGRSEESEEGIPRKTPEARVSLAYHRIRDAVEEILGIRWRASYLYSEEADSILENCRKIITCLEKQLKKILRPSPVNDRKFIESLKSQ